VLLLSSSELLLSSFSISKILSRVFFFWATVFCLLWGSGVGVIPKCVGFKELS
jgi:hypothetical protein